MTLMKTFGAAKSTELDTFLELALIVMGGKCIGYDLKSSISSILDEFSHAKRWKRGVFLIPIRLQMTSLNIFYKLKSPRHRLNH